MSAGASPLVAGAAAQMYLQHPPVLDAGTRWREAFPAIQRAGAGAIYLDSAATTHRPQAVLDAIADFYVADNANPARAHAPARRAAERLADARRHVARFVNASDPLEVVFTRGTTEGVNLVASTWGAANLRAGDRIVMTVSEHNSNLLPWVTAAKRAGATVHVVDVDDEGRIRMDELQRALSMRPRLVAFMHVSNVLGLVNPAKEICTMARAAGARVFVDGAQGAPHVPVDVHALGCDFYAFSGHKMAGPMGVGALWARAELLESMPPYQVGSNMAHEVTFEQAHVETGALKFQAGTPDVAGPVGLAAAVRFLESLGRAATWAHDQALVQRAARRLSDIKGLRVIGTTGTLDRIPVFAFTLAGWKVLDLTAALDARGIAVRGGDLAALPLLKRFGVTEAARASAYLYNTPDDFDRLGDALDELARGRAG